MQRVWVLALVVAMWVGVAHAQSYIHTRDREFVDGSGQLYRIKGISLGNWMVPEGYMFGFEAEGARSPKEIEGVVTRLIGAEADAAFWRTYRDQYVTEADVKLIAAAGFNTIRVPMHFALLEGEDAPGWALLDRLIGWARAAGLHVLLDMHAAPGGQTGVNHDDGTGYPLALYVPAYRNETIALWKKIATRYADEPAVLGYDLLNEPISPYLDEDYLNPRLEPMYRDIAAAVRAVDPHHVLVLEGAQWASNVGLLATRFDPNMAISYHEFWSSTERDAIATFLDYSQHYDIPVFLGESGELTDEWNTRFRTLHDRYGIGWCFWTYKRMGSAETVATIPTPAGWDKVIAYAEGKGPPPADAATVLASFLDGLKLANDRVNRGYLESLGLKTP